MRKLISFFGTKIGVSLVIFVILIGAAVLIRNRETSPERLEKQTANIVVGEIADQLLKRENENGQFKTWEELYGTSTAATSTDSDHPAPKYTSTDLFSQEIFKQYLAKKQDGSEITPEISQQIANDVLAKSYPTSDAAEVSAEKDIQTVPSTYLNLVTYGNALVKAVTIPLPKGYAKSEMESLQDIVNSPELLGEVDFRPYYDRYASIKKALLSMKVPESAAKAHLNVVNGINDLIFSAEGMMNLTTDPIGGIGKTAYYDIGANMLDLGFAQVKAALKDKNVTFSPDEPAYPYFI